MQLLHCENHNHWHLEYEIKKAYLTNYTLISSNIIFKQFFSAKNIRGLISISDNDHFLINE